MLDRLSSYLLYGNLFCGIEHAGSGEGVIYVTLLKKQKTSVDVLDRFQVRKVDELASKLKKNQHATLIINTDKVLTKKVEVSSKKEIELVFHAFPNIDLEQFYYEILNQDCSCFVSICRKDYVDELISTYAENNIMITDFFLGNLVVSSISGFMEEDTFYTSNSVIQKKGADIDSIALGSSPDPMGYDVNGLATKHNFMLSLAGGLHQVLNTYISLTNAADKKGSLLLGFKQMQFFNVFLKFGLGTVFVTLLINYFVFNHYFNSVKDLQAVSVYNKETSQKIMTLKKDVDSIQKLAEDMLQMESSKSSFFINDIIQGLPSSIVLSELNYQPLIKNIKDNDPITNDLNRILINGVSNSSETFSVWVSQLEKLNWVSKVEILDYNDVSASISNFNIKLLLSP